MNNFPALCFLFGIFEISVILVCTYAFMGKRLTYTHILWLTPFFSLVIFYLRSLPLPPFVHSLVLVLLLSFAINLLEKASLFKVIGAVITVFGLLFALETVSIQLLCIVLNSSVKQLTSNPVTWALSGIPHIVILGLLGQITYYYRMRNSGQKTSHV
ncbi:MAG: hypothetical protein H0Z39_09920 [Peptococcaceae bacterium]|nr:hypothetical protein [Peptococcaceae bacterium]